MAIRPGGAARRAAAGGTVLPVIAGVAATETHRALLAHAGELRLRQGSRRRAIRRLILVGGGGPSVLLAQVRGRHAGCAHVRHGLRRFPGGRKLVHAVRRAITPLCHRGHVIVFARVAQRSTPLENGVTDATGRLRLRPDAVKLVNRVAGRHVAHRGMGFGSVTAQTCETSPCPPPAILGAFTPVVTKAVGAPQIIAEARALGVSTIRFGANAGRTRPILGGFARAGLRVVLALRTSRPPAKPVASLGGLARYRARVDATASGLPAGSVIQVENEENAAKFFAGTMAQYGAELEAAVDAGHAHGLKVTNGGLTFKPLVLMAWQDLRRQGREAEADDLVARVFDQPADARILADLRARPFTGLHNPTLRVAWDKARQLVPIYRASAMDWANFHWYGGDDTALAVCVRYLERATGKPAVTTEIGQYDTDPSVVAGHLTTLIDRLHLPLVVWFDADGTPARGLHDAPGVLRPNGQAFRAFAAAHRRVLK